MRFRWVFFLIFFEKKKTTVHTFLIMWLNENWFQLKKKPQQKYIHISNETSGAYYVKLTHSLNIHVH